MNPLLPLDLPTIIPTHEGASDPAWPGNDPTADGGIPRHGRGIRSDGERPGPRLTIGRKIGILTLLLVTVLVAAAGLLVTRAENTSRSYDAILTQQVAQGRQARQMQLELKKQVQEWDNVLLRGYDPADRAKYLAAFEEHDAATQRLNAVLLASATDPAVKARLIDFQNAHHSLNAEYDQALRVFLAGGGQDPRPADDMVRGLDQGPTDLVDDVVAAIQVTIDRQSGAQRDATESLKRTTIAAAGIVALVALLVLWLALRTIIRPIRRLIEDADRAATDRLPAALAAVKNLEPGAEPPVLSRFTVTTGDELHDLGEALNSLQDSALRLAVEQHQVHRETSSMLINLGRRNQNLLSRILSYVTDLERTEQDPQALSQLFRLDHAATRIRRNAESMLVLAGATQTRTWSEPVQCADVVRAALSEIEDYVRVDLHHVEDGLINGAAVADIVHLVAELLENATHFSPPTTTVSVVGQKVREGYRMRVIDQGVGMTRRELDDANRRIRTSNTGWSDAKLLGLFVVGRLARRRGIEVVLEPSAGRGITASILLPTQVLAATGEPRRGEPLVPFQPGLPGTPPRGTAPRAPAASPAGEVTLDLTQLDPEPSWPLVPAGVPPHWTDGAAETSLAPVAGTAATIPLPPRGAPQPSGVAQAPVLSAPPTPRAAPLGGTATGTGTAIPRRVRGAQLPDLGPSAEPELASTASLVVPPETVRWQLRSFQLDVKAARRAIEETRAAMPMDLPGPREHQFPGTDQPEADR